jgi:hypothetical protein
LAGEKAFSLYLYHMRNTTKLKQILLKYDLDLSMDEDNLLKLTLVDKSTGTLASFENSSYSQLINKSYSHFLKELKTNTEKVRSKKSLM